MKGFHRDPLAHPEDLIRHVYAYAAYRLGDGHDAEDVTSEVFERAIRYREAMTARRGSRSAGCSASRGAAPTTALAKRRRLPDEPEPEEIAATGSVEEDTVRRMTLDARWRS